MEINENEKSGNNPKKNITPSSLKNIKFNGMTPEQIIKKYESVLSFREKQFLELSQEAAKVTQKIQNLVQKKEKSKYNNNILKDIYAKNEQLLKQELSNKEIAFMKLTDLEHKYDDLQNKIDYVINRQNAIADSTQKEKEKKLQNKEEGQKVVDMEESSHKTKEEIIIEKENIMEKENKENIEKENLEKENKEILNEDNNKKEENDKNLNEEKKENMINDNKEEDKKIIENNENKEKEKENKENKDNKDNKDNIEVKENEIKPKNENKEKKRNSFLLAKERLNKIKKEKKEKSEKLNLFDIYNQTNNNDNNS